MRPILDLAYWKRTRLKTTGRYLYEYFYLRAPPPNEILVLLLYRSILGGNDVPWDWVGGYRFVFSGAERRNITRCLTMDLPECKNLMCFDNDCLATDERTTEMLFRVPNKKESNQRPQLGYPNHWATKRLGGLDRLTRFFSQLRDIFSLFR